MTLENKPLVASSGAEGSISKDGFRSPNLAKLLNSLAQDLDYTRLGIDRVVEIVQNGLPEQFTNTSIYDLTSEVLASRVIYHPDYSTLAGRVEAYKLQESITTSFSNTIAQIHASYSEKSLISDAFLQVVSKHAEYLDSLIVPKRDFDLPYFGIKTLQKSYLLQCNGEVQETPQYMFLRVAVQIHGNSLGEVKETYDLMSEKYFVHASPTLFNAGTNNNYLSSCFLVALEDDSIDGIFKTLHKSALISKAAGGIGLHAHNIRARGSRIASTGGTSNGLVPMLRVFNNAARYVDQGGNKRPGAIAVYIEPWHADIFEVLNLKKNHGKEEMRARDLFYGLWIPDLFMRRVKADQDWTLFSPDECPGLSDCYGHEFETLYTKYESEGKGERIKAQKLWYSILESQTETGGPYMLFKDACNLKSNQRNLGTIKSSNLCCEVVEYSSENETAVCNLASIALPRYVILMSDGEISFDFKKLHSIVKVVTRNLDKIINITKYPIETSERSNMLHRPIAIGVQGLADLLAELRLPFDSAQARELNIQIFETIYHAAVEASMELAMQHGPYSSFKGSPASQGLLQFDLWEHKPSNFFSDWDELKEKVIKNGLRNSLLVAPMPTASTSQILGYNECFEPYTSNLYTRRVLAGEFQVVNHNLLKDLIELGLWSPSMKDQIIHDNGSVQGIPEIPDHIKQLYKTVWEIPQRSIIDMASDRGRFIDQLQSMNVHMSNPTFGKLTSCHFYAWEKGLKTGMYYLRTQAAARAIQFTVDVKNRAEQTMPVTVSLNRKRYKALKQFKESTIESNPKPSKRIPELSPRLLDDLLTKKLKKGSTSALINTKNSSETPHRYDIYDDTPLSCNILDPEQCDSCSG
ncbi:ribonucleoside-diphosphate reductase alpha subunit, partial [Suhomyces tanzawaensis NRRL Y-17324]